MGVCRFIFDYMSNSHAFLYISNLRSLGMCQIAYVYIDGVTFSLFQNFAKIYILFCYMFEKYSGDSTIIFFSPDKWREGHVICL